jgi:type IV secretion system pilin
MKKLRQLIMAGLVVAGVGSAMLSVPTHAVNVFDQCGANAESSVCAARNDDAPSMVKTVINILLYVLGIISVVMIVIGGIRFATADGDPSGVKSARNTVVYSVVGLVVALLSFAIVNYVLGQF